MASSIYSFLERCNPYAGLLWPPPGRVALTTVITAVRRNFSWDFLGSFACACVQYKNRICATRHAAPRSPSSAIAQSHTKYWNKGWTGDTYCMSCGGSSIYLF